MPDIHLPGFSAYFVSDCKEWPHRPGVAIVLQIYSPTMELPLLTAALQTRDWDEEILQRFLSYREKIDRICDKTEDDDP